MFGLLIGGFLGLLAGYHRRRTDTLIVTVMDILLAFPALVLALMLVTFGQAPDGGDRHIVWGPIHFTLSRFALVVFVLGILSIPPLTRIVRASTLSLSNREFVMASRALGAKNRRIISAGDPPERDPADALVRASPASRSRSSPREHSPSSACPSTADAVMGGMIIEGKNRTADGAMVDRARSPPSSCSSRSSRSTCSVTSRPSASPSGTLSGEEGTALKNIADHRTATGPLLEVDDLRTHFRTDRGMVRAVDGVSLHARPRQDARHRRRVGLGQDGAVPLDHGPARRAGTWCATGRVTSTARRSATLAPGQMRELWGTEMAMVFQDPMTSLNPVMKIGAPDHRVARATTSTCRRSEAEAARRCSC